MHTQHVAKQLICGLVAIAVVLLFGIGAFAQQPVKIFGLTVPGQVGGLTHGPALDYEAKVPGLGFSLGFARPGWSVDVYIYDFGLKVIPTDLESPLIQNHLSRAKGDIFGLERAGVYGSVEETEEFNVGDAGKTRFVCSAFSFLRGAKKDEQAETYLCLTSWNNKFVKIRMTAGKGNMPRADLTNFVEAWISLLSASG